MCHQALRFSWAIIRFDNGAKMNRREIESLEAEAKALMNRPRELMAANLIRMERP